MARQTGPAHHAPGPGGRVTVELPGWAVEALQAHVRGGLFRSVEEAVLAGARIVARLGPRAVTLLEEGAERTHSSRPVTGTPRAGGCDPPTLQAQ